MKYRYPIFAAFMAVVLTLGLAIASFAAPVSDTGDETVNGHWTFQHNVNVHKNLDVDGSANFDGSITANDPVYLEDSMVNKVTRITNSTSTLTWAYSYGNVIQCEIGTVNDLTVTMPDITTAMVGTKVLFKITWLSGTKKLYVAPDTSDYIESSFGTYTDQGTNNSMADAQGYWMELMAFQNGTDSFWAITSRNSSGM
jgi:hypothetical protein